MNTTIVENIFSDEFVSPDLCKTLHFLGLSNQVPYHFKRGQDFCVPFTYAYDTENIYAQMDANLLYTEAIEQFPAYRIKDMERIFDGYNIVKKDRDHYQVSMIYITTNYTASGSRLPDTLGLLLLQLLQNKKISVEACNARMLHV